MVAIFYENGKLPDQIEWFDCDCNDSNHSIRFHLLQWKEGPELYLEAIFPDYLPWYKRLWFAILYVFKKSRPNALYDTWILKKKDVERLQRLLSNYQQST